MKQQFTIHGTLVGLNEMIGAARTHWSASAAQKKNSTEVCAEAARGLIPIVHGPVRISIAWFEPNDRRDADNVIAAQKFVLDGLVNAGILPDDSRKYVTALAHIVVTDKQHPRIVVTLEHE